MVAKSIEGETRMDAQSTQKLLSILRQEFPTVEEMDIRLGKRARTPYPPYPSRSDPTDSELAKYYQSRTTITAVCEQLATQQELFKEVRADIEAYPADSSRIYSIYEVFRGSYDGPDKDRIVEMLNKAYTNAVVMNPQSYDCTPDAM